MKKTTIATILSTAILFSGNLYAENTPLTNENIQGSWALDYTKKSEKSKETAKREDTWVFDKSTVTIKNILREGSYYDQSPVNYVIENGKLKVSILGRSGKFDNFSVLNKEEKSMTLKARFGGIYHFIKK